MLLDNRVSRGLPVFDSYWPIISNEKTTSSIPNWLWLILELQLTLTWIHIDSVPKRFQLLYFCKKNILDSFACFKSPYFYVWSETRDCGLKSSLNENLLLENILTSLVMSTSWKFTLNHSSVQMIRIGCLWAPFNSPSETVAKNVHKLFSCKGSVTFCNSFTDINFGVLTARWVD